MIIEVLMPSLSPTMKSGTIVKWYKKEGDEIKSGDVIADIETDKAIMEFEYIEEDGVLAKILVPENTKGVAVNDLIALITTEEEKDLKLLNEHTKSSPSSTNIVHENKQVVDSKPIDTGSSLTPSNVTASNIKRLFITPLAKKIASDKGVDINSIIGTGPYNRIVKKDVLNELEKKSQGHVYSFDKNTPTDGAQAAGVFSELTNMRMLISQRLTESKNTIPHFYLSVDCNVDNLLELRTNINKINTENKITINDFIVRAVSLSIQKFAAINVSLIENKILHHATVDVAIAVGLKDGLITPIVKNVNEKSLTDISIEIKDLIKRAKATALKPEEFQGGSITISNLGMFGIKQFSAIINPPQSCILAVGASEKRAIVSYDDQIKSANLVTLTLSVDHRVVDGELASNFLNCLKNYIENPLLILL